MERATVIVAIPPVDERVNKVSSETVAHLTLLYLGDIELSEGAVLYVQHACKELSPFGLSVDYRGTLGEDDADVLFFEDSAWDLKRVKEFRHYLLLNDEIKAAYDAADQHPEWTPHLTLGYPEAPARELSDDDGRLSYILFDRIAIWTGDFEGPEFRLKYEDHAMEVAMSDMTTAERGEAAVAELFHHGVKGMKWGVRKAEGAQAKADAKQKQATDMKTRAERRSSQFGSASESRRAAKLQKEADRLQRRADKRWNKADDKWEKSVYSTPGAVAVHNAMAEHFNSRIGAINDRHPDAAPFDRPDTPESKAYMDEVMALESKAYAKAVTSVHGTSPSGKKKAVYIEDENGARIEVRSTDVKHAADDNEPDLVVLLKRDDKGRIVEMNTAEEAVSHADADTFLAHHGVKGMKWGVRKDVETSKGGASVGPTAVVVEQKRPGVYAKSRGGEGHPIHEDAVRALEARQKAKASTTDALSNVELRKAVERMNLEKQYNQLQFESDRRSKGVRFIAGLFGHSRYNGEKRRYKDDFEQQGEYVRKQVKDVLNEMATQNSAA